MNSFHPEVFELIQKLFKILSKTHTPADKAWHNLKFELSFYSRKDDNSIVFTQAEFKQVDDDIQLVKKVIKKKKRN